MKLIRVFAGFALGVVLSTASSAQHPTDGSPTEIAADVQGIHRSLDRLVALLEEMRQQQHVELLMKRIELKERRLAPLEGRLRSAEGEARGLEDELKHMEMMRDQAEQEIDDEIRAGTDDPESEARRMLHDFERMIEPLKARLDEARLRVRQAEDDLLDGREEIEILDDMLVELLEPERR